jgi:hypothetical protein
MQTKTASRLSTAYAALLTLRPCRPVLTLEIAASIGQARPGARRISKGGRGRSRSPFKITASGVSTVRGDCQKPSLASRNARDRKRATAALGGRRGEAQKLPP